MDTGGYDTFDDFQTPIVIDNGSGSIKAGIAGRERPTAVIPSCIGQPKHRRVMLGAARQEKYFFDESMDNRGLCRITYPIVNGIISNFDDMTLLWQYVYKELINLPMEEHPVLLTEAPNNPIRNRMRTSQIFFEQCNVPALYFGPPPVLALYASGRLTGCVLDSGHGLTSVIPICEGFAISHAITRMDIAGDSVTKYFRSLLRKTGYCFDSSSELETVRKIKESQCEIQIINGRNKSKVSSLVTSSDKNNNSLFRNNSDLMIMASDLDDENNNTSSSTLPKYKLPDGTEITIGSSRFRAPEVLFNPSLIGKEYGGIQQCILDSINLADLDLRKDLYRTIVLSGGTTNTKNFGRRLVAEIQSKVPRAKIKIYAPHERHLTTWIGGSLLSVLEGFRPMWIRNKEFQEFGPTVLFRKSFF